MLAHLVKVCDSNETRKVRKSNDTGFLHFGIINRICAILR